MVVYPPWISLDISVLNIEFFFSFFFLTFARLQRRSLITKIKECNDNYVHVLCLFFSLINKALSPMRVTWTKSKGKNIATFVLQCVLRASPLCDEASTPSHEGASQNLTGGSPTSRHSPDTHCIILAYLVRILSLLRYLAPFRQHRVVMGEWISSHISVC